MNGTNMYDLPTLKNYLLDHSLIKYEISEVTVKYSPRCTHIGIIYQYYDNNNISYVPQSTNNSPWNWTFPEINRTNVWIIIIWIKEPTSSKKVMESISVPYITFRWNIIHFITSHRNKNIFRTNPQENISIFNKIIHVQEIGKKLISLPIKSPPPNQIGDVVKSTLWDEWYDSIFTYD